MNFFAMSGKGATVVGDEASPHLAFGESLHVEEGDDAEVVVAAS